MEIGIGLVVMLAIFALVVAIVGRRFPGIGLLSMVLFMIGFGLALFVPISVWWKGVGWAWDNLILIKDFLLARLGGFSPGDVESPSAEDVAKFAGVCLGGVFMLVMFRKATVLVLGLIAGIFIQVLLRFLNIPLPFG
ncbi:hypothetical protein ES706_05765 [subsurface metagenome]